MSTESNIIEKLKGIYEHTVSNENDNENDNAKKLLNALLKKHNLVIEDIKDSDKKKYSFKYVNNTHKKLLFNIVSKYVDNWDNTYYQKKNKKQIVFVLTLEQFLIIEQAFDVYKKALDEELDNTLLAFIYKNRIHPDFSENSNDKKIKLTEKELDIINKMDTTKSVNFDFIKTLK